MDTCAFLSNRLEYLYKRLKERLFLSAYPPFSRRLVVVSSPLMKSWLMQQMAKDPDVGIATGVEITYLHQAVAQLHESCSTSSWKEKIPTQLELALSIEVAIKEIFQECAEKDFAPDIWLPVLAHLKLVQGKLTRKGEKRLAALAEKMSQLFIRYGIYAQKMVEEWEKKPLINWQQALWKHLFLEKQWSYPCRELSECFFQIENFAQTQIHIFAMSFLSRVDYEFFMQLSQVAPLSYYVLSPCQQFWSDILSDREKKRMHAFWKGKLASENQLEAMDAYLSDNNALLANFGKIGREMALQIEASDIPTHEDYGVCSPLQKMPDYEEMLRDEVHFEEKSGSLTLIEALQADMALLRNPESAPKIVFGHYDRTLQIHVAPTPMREIQILYHNLMNIIDQHAQDKAPILPSDIFVMAPDIAAYEPFIKAVFGNAESQLDFHIVDLSMPSQSDLVQGFLHLLNLPFSRWDAASLLQLFEYPAFQLKQKLSKEEIHEIRNWVKKSAVRWGNDSQHRNEILKRDHCLQGMLEETPIGTWEDGLERLLAGMVMFSSDETAHIFSIESISISTTKSELLGKLIKILRSLQEDLKPLGSGLAMNLNDWAEYLKCLFEAYFTVDKEDHAFVEHHKALFTHINQIKAAFHHFKDDQFSYTTIRRHLESMLESQKISYRETHLHAVRFCSMLPMRAIPAKVIALIGMQEGSFPRSEQPHSLDLMEKSSKSDYCPSQTDFDRFLFLEALLSCRNYFLMSYQGQALFDAKEQSSSLLVTELLGYLDKAFQIGDKNISDLCVFKHPLYSFDKSYFDSKDFGRSYSNSDYRAALAYYHLEKRPKHLFVPEFILSPSLRKSEEIFIDLKQLISLAQDPLKTYFGKTLGFYLEREEDRQIKVDENFILSPREIASLKKASLKGSLNDLLRVAEKEGRLPFGPFKTMAVEKVQQEYDSLQANLAATGVDTAQIFQIDFNEKYSTPAFHEGKWTFPPLELKVRDSLKVKIVGHLPEVSSNGLIVHHKDDRVDVVKAWPQFLALSCLCKTYSPPIDSRLIFAKSGSIKSPFFSDPYPHLERYIEYYFTSLESPSPLIPDWVFSILTKDSEAFEEEIHKDIFQSPHFYNDCLKWMLTGSDIPNVQCLLGHWQGQARTLFEELYEHWYADRKHKGSKP